MANPVKNPTRIVITGATSGIGEELARQYASSKQQGLELALTGRRRERLDALAQELEPRGVRVRSFALDVTDGPAMKAMAQELIAAWGAPDLVIANAGVGAPDELKQGDPDPLTHLIDVNVNGVLNTLVPYIPVMREAGQGQLVAIASVAGYRPLPGHTTYCASKRCLRDLMEGYGHTLRRYGLIATTINPGFVVSEMTAKNKFHMPWMLDTPEACRRIRAAIARGDREYTFPFPMRVLANLLATMPGWAVDSLIRRRTKTKAQA